MAISLAVLLIPILAITWFFTETPDPEVEEVDVFPVLEIAQAESPYPVLYPEGLGENWIPTRVAWAADGEPWITDEPAVGNSWQLGYLSPNDIYVAVQQRDRAQSAFVTSITRDGKQGDEVEISGRAWEQWTSSDRRTRSLVWRDGEMVAVVTGDTDFEALEEFASRLVTGS